MSRPVVGVVGEDVPVELLTASGAVPVRLHGRPETDRSLGDQYLGTGVDPWARALLSALLAGEWPGLSSIVVGRDSEASSRLFFALRELHRIGSAPGVPPVVLCDVLHLPHATTTQYVARRLDELLDFDDVRLAEAVRLHNRLRTSLSELPLVGAEGLAARATVRTLPPAEGIAFLEGLPAPTPPPGMRIHLTGSVHDEPSVYEALEKAGYVVVSDDQNLALRGSVPEDLLGLAEYYQDLPLPARSAPRARAALLDAALTASRPELVVAYLRERDDAPAWDVVAQRAVAARHGVPIVVLEHQPYGQIDLEQL